MYKFLFSLIVLFIFSSAEYVNAEPSRFVLKSELKRLSPNKRYEFGKKLCKEIGFPKLSSALSNFNLDVQPIFSEFVEVEDDKEIKELRCGVRLSWIKEPQSLRNCLEQHNAAKKAFDYLTDTLVDALYPYSVTPIFNCSSGKFLDYSQSNHQILDDSVILNTGTGSGQFDKMTYSDYLSIITFIPDSNLSVREIKPEIYFCNGTCKLSLTVLNPDGTTVANASSSKANDANLTLELKHPIRLYKDKTYIFYLRAQGSQAIGIHTAGIENVYLNTRINLLYAGTTLSFYSPLNDFTDNRGPIAFKLIGQEVD